MKNYGRARLSRRDAMRLLGVGTGAGLVSVFNRADALLALQNSDASKVAFPRGAIIRTLLKDLPPQSLAGGATLFHEHLSMSSPFPYAPPPPKPVSPNFTGNVDLMVEEARIAGKEGVACIVDAGHADMGRKMDALNRIARESGVHIVASGGYWTQSSYPPDLATKSEDQLADELVREAVANRFGAFGELGTSNEITLNERKVFRAIGKAHVRTGIPIFTHNAVYKPDAHDTAMKVAMLQLDIFESVGVKPQNVVVGHLCCSEDPKARVPIAVARRGASVGIDRVNFNNILPDAKRVEMALAFLDAGLADKLLLASDFAVEADLKAKGGNGYARTVTVFAPMLTKAGVKEATVRSILVDNPRRFLAFVPKNAARG